MEHRTGKATTPVEDGKDELRSRIAEAAFAVLMEKGYAGASTIEIATRAKVSKRDLYALFGSKQGILAAMIAGTSARMRRPLTLPHVGNRTALATALTEFGTASLREICQPSVAALFRLAIAEAERSPELARVLDDNGRTAMRTTLVEFLTRARAADLIGKSDPGAMAGQFFSLLFGDLILRVAMRVIDPPPVREMSRRAQAAAAAVLALHPAGTPSS